MGGDILEMYLEVEARTIELVRIEPLDLERYRCHAAARDALWLRLTSAQRSELCQRVNPYPRLPSET